MRYAALTIVVTLCATPSAFGQFDWGVAAGDVTDNSAILWTKFNHEGLVRVVIAADDSFETILFEQSDLAAEDTDLTLRLMVDGLSPSTEYHYRFEDPNAPSVVSAPGRFKTAPLPDASSEFSFVLTGDSDFLRQPFRVLGAAADEDADFAIYLGDLIYADIPAGGLGVATTLEGYRAKYVQNRSDPFLREWLAGAATWAQWDDHEVVNDYHGADPQLPLTREQIEAAYQAFFEYLPVRQADAPDEHYQTYRSFRYGAVAEFFILDCRQYRQPDVSQECDDNPDPLGMLTAGLTQDGTCAELLRAPRTMLGDQQLAWLQDRLLNSTATLKFVVTSVPMSFLGLLPYDHWDGYDAERKDILEFIDANRISGVWFLTTDAHTNAFNPNVARYFRLNRPDYALPNGVVMPEVICGPVATRTMYAAVTSVGASLLNLEQNSPLVDILFAGLLQSLRRANGMTFIEPDKYAYALLKVSPGGTVSVTFKGIDPQDNADGTGQVSTLYETSLNTVTPTSPCGAGLLTWMVATIGVLGLCRGWAPPTKTCC